jgi:hypothetical protein
MLLLLDRVRIARIAGRAGYWSQRPDGRVTIHVGGSKPLGTVGVQVQP